MNSKHNIRELKDRKLKVCVCTSYAAHQEPRAPRHAKTLAGIPGAQVTFVDAAARGSDKVSVDALNAIDSLDWKRFDLPHRRDGVGRLIGRRLKGKVARMCFYLRGGLLPAVLNPALDGFTRLLRSERADIYMSHNVDTLLPAWTAAMSHKSVLIFDSMEFHSDMGESESGIEDDIISAIERKCLTDCSLVTASSPEVATALKDKYRLKSVLSLYNSPPLADRIANRLPGFNLYWRNSVIGFGQRGLSDLLEAMQRLPHDIHLHLQGRLPVDGGAELRRCVAKMGLTDRITVLQPYKPENAVIEASRFQVGLCLERKCNRNHELTVSNKMFDYHMAGLAVVSSDLSGLRNVVEQSGGGLLYVPGDVQSLVESVMKLYSDRMLLAQKAKNSREFALSQGNVEYEMSRFMSALSTTVLPSVR
jgi:glycogen(starch) synthase